MKGSSLLSAPKDIITELILKLRADPVVVKTFTGTKSFQTDSSNLSCKKSKSWKLLEMIINSRQGLSRNTIVIFQKWIPGNIFRIRYSFGPDSMVDSLNLYSTQACGFPTFTKEALATWRTLRLSQRDSKKDTQYDGPLVFFFGGGGGWCGRSGEGNVKQNEFRQSVIAVRSMRRIVEGNYPRSRQTSKFEENIHKRFLERRQSNIIRMAAPLIVIVLWKLVFWIRCQMMEVAFSLSPTCWCAPHLEDPLPSLG